MRKCPHWEKHQQSPWQYLLSSLWNDIPELSLQSLPGFLLINMQQSKDSPPGWPYNVFNMLLPIPMKFSQISVISLWGPHPSSPWKPCSFSLPSTHSMGHVGGVLPNVTTKIALDFKKYSFITLWPKIWTFSLQFVSDSACKTEQLCNFNSDSIYVMNCIPCVVHLTIGLDLQLCFISSKRKWVCGPCPLTPLLSIPSDPTCLP